MSALLHSSVWAIVLGLSACAGTQQAEAPQRAPGGTPQIDSATAVTLARKAADERRPAGETRGRYEVVGFFRERGAVRVILRLRPGVNEVIVGGGAEVRLSDVGDVLSIEYLQ